MRVRTLTRRVTAPVVALALAGGAAAPVVAEEKPAQMATGPGSSEFTQDEVNNAGRFIGLLLGIMAVLATIGAAALRATGGSLPLPALPR